MKTIASYFDRWALDSYRMSGQSLAIYRIAYVLLVLFFNGPPSYVWLSTIPDYFYRPHLFSIGSLFTGFQPYPVLFALTLATSLLYICLLFGYRTRAAGIALFLCLTLGNSFRYSFGKLGHDELMAMLVPLVMSFSGWENAYSIDALRKRSSQIRSWPVALLALLLAFAMFSAGVPKLLGGWLDLTTMAVRGHFLNRAYAREAHDYLSPFFVNFNNRLFWESLDYAAMAFELGFLVAVVSRPLFRFFLLVAISFHVMNLLILNISFASNLLVYLLFIDWQPVEQFLRREPFRACLRLFEKPAVFLVVLVGCAGFVALRNHLNPGINDNGLRASINTMHPDSVVSLLDLVERYSGFHCDAALLLSILAIFVAMAYCIRFVFTLKSVAAAP